MNSQTPWGKLLVLDFSTLLPGPLATLMLADLGAEVVKVERPDVGDEMRGFEPRWGRDSVNFSLLNRGKKSVSIDLKDEKCRQLLQPLLERADVLVEQFRPGVMDRLGLSYREIKKLNPDIIYCSITGYGQSGPKSLDAGHDLNYQGETGLLSLSQGPLESPVVPPALIADIAGGAYPAMINILIALAERDQGRGGRHLDVSMSDNLFPFMYWALGNGFATGQWPKSSADLVTGGSPRYRLYRTADEKLIAAAPLEDRFWVRFCDAIQLEDTLRHSTADQSLVCKRIADEIGAKDSLHWAAVFARVECCCSVVYTLAEALAHPHFQGRGLFDDRVLNNAGETIPALPLPLDRSFRSSTKTQAAPTLGADNHLLSS